MSSSLSSCIYCLSPLLRLPTPFPDPPLQNVPATVQRDRRSFVGSLVHLRARFWGAEHLRSLELLVLYFHIRLSLALIHIYRYVLILTTYLPPTYPKLQLDRLI